MLTDFNLLRGIIDPTVFEAMWRCCVGPLRGGLARDFHPRRSTLDFHSNQRVQLRGRKNFLVSVRVINLGYHIMHIHKYTEYLGYLIGMVRLEVIPLVAGVCAGFFAHTLIAKANQKFKDENKLFSMLNF